MGLLVYPAFVCQRSGLAGKRGPNMDMDRAVSTAAASDRASPARAGATILLALLLAQPVLAGDLPPFADIHLHYSYDQQEVTSPAEAVQRLEEDNVVLAAVSSTPPELALRLREAGGDWIIPLYQPYRGPREWLSWFHDPSVPARVRAALESGNYFGIGEVHLIPGFARRSDTPVFDELASLAEAFDVPFLIHTEASAPQLFLDICRRYPKVSFLWAHAGGILPPAVVADTMAGCPNVWTELSARDPWRFQENPIAGPDGALLPERRELVLRYPDRFMTGSDAVWPVDQLNAWYEADTGWQRLDQFLEFHRGWLAGLPPAVAERVRLQNALPFFGRESTLDTASN